MQVLFSVLSYHPSFITTESINVGILFHDIKNDIRIFETTSNWNRVKTFDDEIDINYIKAVLDGIKNEVENCDLFSFSEEFNMEQYVKFYVNELKFSEVAPANTDSFEDFIEETKKIFLRYDFDKKDRPNEKQQLKYVKEFLKSNNIEYSSKSIIGKYDENINFDYTIDDYVFKMFTFENKNISKQLFAAKSWAYNAEKIKPRYKTIFIYDIEKENDPQYCTIMKILKDSSYKVMKLSEAIDFILKLNNQQNFLLEATSD